jgi:uncharacterized membrane protein
MTEAQIEARVARWTDQADARYLAGQITDAEYRDQLDDIDTWATDAMEWAKREVAR